MLGLLGLLVLVAAASLMWGARDVSAGQVWQALVDPVAGNNDHLVVRQQRVPRTLIGLSAGWRSGPPGRSCRASPATRSPTRVCSASTPVPRSA